MLKKAWKWIGNVVGATSDALKLRRRVSEAIHTAPERTPENAKEFLRHYYDKAIRPAITEAIAREYTPDKVDAALMDIRAAMDDVLK